MLEHDGGPFEDLDAPLTDPPPVVQDKALSDRAWYRSHASTLNRFQAITPAPAR